MNNKNSFQIIALQIILVFFALLLFLKDQHGWVVACLVLLLIANRLDVLKRIVFSVKNGIEADFDLKTIENIVENKEPISKITYLSYKEIYQEIESKVIHYISKRYGASVKIYHNYSLPNRFLADLYVESPDGKNEIYEIKYIKSKDNAATIAKNAERQLLKYSSLLKGSPKLNLILASEAKIDVSKINLSQDISVEYFKL